MPVVASCQCGARFAAQDHLAGKTVRCPKCSQPLQIPAASAATTTPQSTQAPQPKQQPQPQPRKQPPASAPAASPDHVGGILDEVGVTAVMGVRCPQCSSDTRPDAIICVKCGYNLQRGRALKVQSDAALAKKREAIDAKKAAAAERRLKRTEKVKRVGTGEAMDLGGVTEAATAIIIYPTETFKRLSTIGSTRAAYEFAFVSGFFIGLFWMLLFSVYFIMSPMAAIVVDPSKSQQIGKSLEIIMPAYLQAILGFTAGYFGMLVVTLCVFAPAMAGGAHLILKLVGNSPLGYGATLRVIVYTTGASFLLSGLPCLQIAAPINWLVNTTIGFAVHHRVNGGVAILALVVGYAALFAAAILFYLLVGASLTALFVILSAPRLM